MAQPGNSQLLLQLEAAEGVAVGSSGQLSEALLQLRHVQMCRGGSLQGCKKISCHLLKDKLLLNRLLECELYSV
jgi:hypothetical protein